MKINKKIKMILLLILLIIIAAFLTYMKAFLFNLFNLPYYIMKIVPNELYYTKTILKV